MKRELKRRGKKANKIETLLERGNKKANKIERAKKAAM